MKRITTTFRQTLRTVKLGIAKRVERNDMPAGICACTKLPVNRLHTVPVTPHINSTTVCESRKEIRKWWVFTRLRVGLLLYNATICAGISTPYAMHYYYFVKQASAVA